MLLNAAAGQACTMRLILKSTTARGCVKPPAGLNGVWRRKETFFGVHLGDSRTRRSGDSIHGQLLQEVLLCKGVEKCDCSWRN